MSVPGTQQPTLESGKPLRATPGASAPSRASAVGQKPILEPLRASPDGRKPFSAPRLPSSPSGAVRPISAEARGRRRLLRGRLADAAERLLLEACSPRARALAEAWTHKRGRGQARTLGHIRSLLSPMARLHSIEKDCLVFRYLRPSSRIVLTDDASDPGLGQDGISVRALLVRADAIRTNHWHLEFSDHCIGRLLERSPRADPVAVMLNAHDQALRMADFADEFWLPAGDWGAFACEALFGTAEDDPNTLVRPLRCRTWYDADM